MKILKNNRGCFGGKPATPAVQPPPDPAPSPVGPSEVESQVSAEDRRRKLERLRRGLRSNIKTSAKGLSGSGADLLTQTITGKTNLGA